MFYTKEKKDLEMYNAKTLAVLYKVWHFSFGKWKQSKVIKILSLFMTFSLLLYTITVTRRKQRLDEFWKKIEQARRTFDNEIIDEFETFGTQRFEKMAVTDYRILFHTTRNILNAPNSISYLPGIKNPCFLYKSPQGPNR